MVVYVPPGGTGITSLPGLWERFNNYFGWGGPSNAWGPDLPTPWDTRSRGHDWARQHSRHAPILPGVTPPPGPDMPGSQSVTAPVPFSGSSSVRHAAGMGGGFGRTLGGMMPREWGR